MRFLFCAIVLLQLFSCADKRKAISSNNTAVTSDSDVLKIINRTFEKSAFNYKKSMHVSNDTLYFNLTSSDSVFDPKFTDAFLQLMIYDLKTVIKKVGLIAVKVSASDVRTEPAFYLYSPQKIDTIKSYFTQVSYYQDYIRYILEEFSAIDIIRVDAQLEMFYELSKDEKFNLDFRELVWEHAKYCQRISDDSAATEVIHLLEEYYHDFKKPENELMEFHLSYLQTLCSKKSR